MKLTQFLFNNFFVLFLCCEIDSFINSMENIVEKKRRKKKRKLIEMMSQLLKVLFRFGFCFHHKTVVFAQITKKRT